MLTIITQFLLIVLLFFSVPRFVYNTLRKQKEQVIILIMSNIIEKIKIKFLDTSIESFRDITQILQSIDIDINDVILSITPKQAKNMQSWFDAYLSKHFDSTPEMLKLNDKSINHLFNIIDYKITSREYKIFDCINFFDDNNLKKISKLIKTAHTFHNDEFYHNLLYIIFYNKNNLYKKMNDDILNYVIDNVKNTHIMSILKNHSHTSYPSKYFKKIISRLSLDEMFYLIINKPKTQYINEFKLVCKQNNTTWNKFITGYIQKHYLKIHISSNFWEKIIPSESCQDIKPIIDIISIKGKKQQCGLSKEILKLYENKMILEEKNLLKEHIQNKENYIKGILKI